MKQVKILHPVMKYHGAKFRLAPWVISHFPDHETYVEPFGGAAGVLLQKKRVYAEIYNDLDDDIVNVFRVLQDPFKVEELTRRLIVTPFSRKEFELAYEETEDPIERARRTLMRASMGFGSASSTKGKSGFRVDMRRSYGTASHLWAKYPSQIASFVERFQGVLIENRPAIDVMKQHDHIKTLHYVDPPYVEHTRSGGNRYYRHEMTDEEHEILLNVLLDLNGFVALSGYDTEIYNDMLTNWTKHTTTSRISAHRGTSVRTECIWLNPVCSNLQAQYQLFNQ